MDEATASIDKNTDRMLQSVLRSEFRHSTVLTIAHRLETIMDSNRVMVVDDGRIVFVFMASHHALIYGHSFFHSSPGAMSHLHSVCFPSSLQTFKILQTNSGAIAHAHLRLQ